MTTHPSTILQVLAAIHQLNEADRVRVLQFALGILQSRWGKKERRRSRFQQPELDNSWRIGE